MLNLIKTNDHNQNTFSFAVMGDNRDGDNVFKEILKKISRDKDIFFAINNGDLVHHGYKKEYIHYLKIIKTFDKPLLSVIGNHEILKQNGGTNYKKLFGKKNFAFSYANSYFIVLDSSTKTIKKKQLQWLRKELKISQKFTNIFVFTHVPLYDPRYGKYAHGHSFKSLKKAKKLNDLFDKYNVTMLFCSHIHFYHKGRWQKTPYIITGGAGAPMNRHNNERFFNYIKVIINGAHVKYKVIKVNIDKKPGNHDQ